MVERLRIVLVAPRIAANVGKIARTCAALRAELHLVGPFGFSLDEKTLKRASVGYFEDIYPIIHRDSEMFWGLLENSFKETEFHWATKHAETLYTDRSFGKDVLLIFGNEEEGVDPKFWPKPCKDKDLPKILSCRIPMHQVRCLNLATSVGIIGYEVFRQWSGKGATQ